MSTGMQVEASTIRAGQLFSTSRFLIPDFQRQYSWRVEQEVAPFWSDLLRGIVTPPYFLGLLIMTDEDGRKTIVDGQQRIVTISLLANAVRKAAEKRGKSLVADSMRDFFLYAIDYDRDQRVSRISFVSHRDRETFSYVLDGIEDSAGRELKNSDILDAQEYLDKSLEEDLAETEGIARLGRWAYFLQVGITFALFEHPDRNAAYKVFEVVNMRGKDLTPAELLKSYVIGTTEVGKRSNIYQRWMDLEEPFVDVKAHSQFTQFVRAVVTLSFGYVEPRELYQIIDEHYPDTGKVATLIESLEQKRDDYMQMVVPSRDGSGDVDNTFSILHELGLRTVRPMFLAVMDCQDTEEGFRELIKVIVPRIVVGNLGTGSIERRFAEVARRIHLSGQWREEVAALVDLIPSKDEFVDRLAHRPLNKSVHHVVRASVLQTTVTPRLDGFLHQVRTRNVDAWPDFDDEAFRIVGSSMGNYFISSGARRPRGTNSQSDAISRLLPTHVDYEDDHVKRAVAWSSNDVRRMNERFLELAGDIWYGH